MVRAVFRPIFCQKLSLAALTWLQLGSPNAHPGSPAPPFPFIYKRIRQSLQPCCSPFQVVRAVFRPIFCQKLSLAALTWLQLGSPTHTLAALPLPFLSYINVMGQSLQPCCSPFQVVRAVFRPIFCQKLSLAALTWLQLGSPTHTLAALPLPFLSYIDVLGSHCSLAAALFRWCVQFLGPFSVRNCPSLP